MASSCPLRCLQISMDVHAAMLKACLSSTQQLETVVARACESAAMAGLEGLKVFLPVINTIKMEEGEPEEVAAVLKQMKAIGLPTAGPEIDRTLSRESDVRQLFELFDIFWDRFSRLSPPPHTPYATLYLVPVLIGC